MKTRDLFFAFTICFIGILLSSCKAGQGTSGKNPLTGTSWILQQDDHTKLVKVFSDKIFVVYAIDSHGIMQTQHSGTYEIEGENLTEVIRHASPDRTTWIGKDASLKVNFKNNQMKSAGQINSDGFGRIVEEWTRIESKSQMLK